VFNIIILTSQSGGLNKTIGVTLNLVNATAIATLRILAAKHFLSDVIVGAIVGSGIAYLTTELHKDNPKSNTNEFEPMRFNLSIPF
jgi:membrane-associated phospholipid phosphatase